MTDPLSSRLRPVALATYPIALMLFVIPLTDALARVWPVQVGQLTWRFGAVGIFSSALLTPLLASFLALLSAAILGQFRVQMLLGALLALGALVLLAVLPLFALDSLQVLEIVVPGDRRSFEVAGIKAAAKVLVAVVIAGAMGQTAIRSARRQRRARARRKSG